MPDRLSPLDVSFLYLEEPTTAMHVGSVMIFDPGPEGLDYARLVRHVNARIAFVPRYRQRVRGIPGRLANPVWVDDERFDISYHVRRSALPRPGSPEQLQELVARLQARRLDRGRPLWELIVVEGTGRRPVRRGHQGPPGHGGWRPGGRPGPGGARRDPDAHEPPPHTWRPSPEPSLVELVAGAVSDSVRRPQHVLDTLRSGLGTSVVTAGKAVEASAGSRSRPARRPARPRAARSTGTSASTAAS
jgi:hypothetical protein